jgi:hypothetical protein
MDATERAREVDEMCDGELLVITVDGIQGRELCLNEESATRLPPNVEATPRYLPCSIEHSGNRAALPSIIKYHQWL